MSGERISGKAALRELLCHAPLALNFIFAVWLGRVSGVTTKKDSGSSTVTLASSVAYQPFGPLAAPAMSLLLDWQMAN